MPATNSTAGCPTPRASAGARRAAPPPPARHRPRLPRAAPRLRPRPPLAIRCGQTRDGWCLHFTGDLATSEFCNDIFNEIERRSAAQ
jgi:hypothetical protein